MTPPEPPMPDTAIDALKALVEGIDCNVKHGMQISPGLALALDNARAVIAAAEASVAGEQTCTRCNGSGTVSAMAGQGPDAYDVDVDCPECRGTGARPAADPPQPAVKVPPEMTAELARLAWPGYYIDTAVALWNACRAETIRLNAARVEGAGEER